MRKVFVTRQPIFDKDMKIYGYELLYRQNHNTDYEDVEENRATAKLLDKLIHNEFDDFVDGTHGFISLPEKLILELIPRLLPKERLVIEIRGSVPVSDELTNACKKLKSMGYTLALCDFSLEKETKYVHILPYIDMIKVKYSQADIRQQIKLVNKYRTKVILAAECIESVADYHYAYKMGYHLFQGFFFCEPVITTNHEIGSLANNLTLVISALSSPEPDYKYIAKIIESDVELSYKLLRMANSAFYANKCGITSILQAIVFIGTDELLQWSHLLLIKGIQNPENAELVKASLVRGKLLSLLAVNTQRKQDESDYFITGIFSSIDVLLGESIKNITDRLPLSKQVKDALIGEPNSLRNWLDAICGFEKTQWEQLENMLENSGITEQKFMSLYSEALKWCNKINTMLC